MHKTPTTTTRDLKQNKNHHSAQWHTFLKKMLKRIKDGGLSMTNIRSFEVCIYAESTEVLLFQHQTPRFPIHRLYNVSFLPGNTYPNCQCY